MENKGLDAVQSVFPFIGEGKRIEKLMPLEAAAKRIFVRANGLSAYNRAMGYVRQPERRLVDASKRRIEEE